MLQRFARFLEVREATDEEMETAFQPDEEAGNNNNDDDGHTIKASIEQYNPSRVKRQQNQFGQQQFVDVDNNEVEKARNNFVSMLHISKQSVQPTLGTPMKSVKLPLEGATNDSSVGLGSSASVQRPNVSFTNNNNRTDVDDTLSEVSLESNDDDKVATNNNNAKSEKYDQQILGVDENQRSISSKQERSCNVLYLDESLLSAIAKPDAHYTDDLDEQIKLWVSASLNGSAQLEQPVIATNHLSNQTERREPLVNAANNLDEKNSSSSVAKIKELTGQVTDLQNKLNHAEKVRAEMEAAVLFTQEEHLKRIRELETTIKELEFRANVAEAKSLSIELLKNRRSESNGAANTDDLLKHCAKLKRRLESDSSETTGIKDAEATRIAGQRLAVLGAKVAACEQQIKDEKLVLKNLFLSWMERGERKDAFEILARAFEFTPEDRQRLEPKPSWQRGAALGAKWSLTESLADFVRDETS